MKIPRAAKQEALRNNGQYKLGACLIYQGKVLAKGRNQPRTHPKSKALFQSLHAEMSVLFKLHKGRVIGTTLVVVRIGRDGKLKNAKPCPACQQVITERKLRKVIYSTNSGLEVLYVNNG